MIIAKAVIPNQYWILRDDSGKVGNIEADPSGGFQVRINNQVQRFRNIGTLKKKVPIDFQNVQKQPVPASDNSVHGFHTTSRPFNAIYDVKHQVPLWTREARSKSWYAAGWYLVRQGRRWTVEECPKLIMLERYQYQGPFLTEEEARTHEPSHQ